VAKILWLIRILISSSMRILNKIISLLFICFTPFCYADFTIAVVGKTKNDSFYQQSFKGCQAFASQHHNVQCIYDGPADFQDVRGQVIIIDELLDQGIDALLVSTTDSHFLVRGVLKKFADKNIPVITFDSDLLPEHQQYRLSYVGTNNFDFGKALGEFIKQYKQDTVQTICLQSGHPTTPNLNERMDGVRFALEGRTTERLTGEQGWREHDRCPLYTLGKRETAVTQLKTMVKPSTPPIFLAVAGFAQFSDNYISQLMPFKTRINSGEITIVSADTEDSQLLVLASGLSDANIGQKPFEMGRLGASLLFDYLTDKSMPAKSHYYLDYHYCTPGNVATCTTNY